MDAPRDRDLGALAHALTKELIRRETPILDRHGISMWQYAVLTALGSGPAPQQAQLAERVGRDPTRLIGDLDRLQERGFLQRVPDAVDRRARVVSITPAGRRTLAACRSAIRGMEDELLAGVPARDAAALFRVLHRLAATEAT